MMTMIMIMTVFMLPPSLDMITGIDRISRRTEAVNLVMQEEHVIAPLFTVGFNSHCMRSVQAGDLTEATFFTFQTGEVFFALGGCHYCELTDLHIHFLVSPCLGL